MQCAPEIHKWAVESGRLFVETHKALEEDAQRVLDDLESGDIVVAIDGVRHVAKKGEVSLSIVCPPGMTNHKGMTCSK